MKWVRASDLPGTGSDEAPGRNGGAKNRVLLNEVCNRISVSSCGVLEHYLLLRS